jgi:hypothetical protein
MAQKEVAFKVVVDTSEVSEGVEKSIESVEELGNATKKTSDQMKSGFKSAEQGAKSASSGIAGIGGSIVSVIKSLGKIGAVLAVLQFLRDLLMKNQFIVDLLGKSLKTVEIVFGRVTKAVEDLVDSLKELKNFDIRKIAEQFTNFGKALADSTDGALDLAEKVIKMEKAVAKAEATQRLYALTLQTEIEKQRQVRDDISLTIAKRQEANDKIAVLIDQQLKGEQALANKKLELALIEKDIANNNEESQIKVIEARTELVDIEERLTGVLSEQKTNREALRNEEDQRLEELLVNYEGALEYLRNLDINSEFDAQIQANLQAQLDAQEEYKIALDGMRQYLKENNEGMTADQIENHSQMIAIQKAYEKKLTKIAKDGAEIRRAAQISAAVAVSSALGSINQLMLQQGQENTVAAKTLGIAQIAIDTAVAISGAIKTATQGSATPWDMIAGIAAGVAAVISAVTQATSIINGVNIGGGTATTPSASSVTAAAAPSFNPVTTNTTELGNTQAAELAPIQAFVVETQLTESQFNINQIESQATFGGEFPG